MRHVWGTAFQSPDPCTGGPRHPAGPPRRAAKFLKNRRGPDDRRTALAAPPSRAQVFGKNAEGWIGLVDTPGRGEQSGRPRELIPVRCRRREGLRPRIPAGAVVVVRRSERSGPTTFPRRVVSPNGIVLAAVGPNVRGPGRWFVKGPARVAGDVTADANRLWQPGEVRTPRAGKKIARRSLLGNPGPTSSMSPALASVLFACPSVKDLVDPAARADGARTWSSGSRPLGRAELYHQTQAAERISFVTPGDKPEGAGRRTPSLGETVPRVDRISRRRPCLHPRLQTPVVHPAPNSFGGFFPVLDDASRRVGSGQTRETPSSN